jgi:VanZ family protein
MTTAARFSGATFTTVTALLIVLIVTIHLVPTGTGDAYVRGAFFDVAHVMGFAAVTALLIAAYRHKARTLGISEKYVYAGPLTSVLIIALVSEAAQFLTARHADLADFGRDVSGIVVGLIIAVAFQSRPSQRRALILIAIACLTASMYQPVRTLVARTIVWVVPSTCFGFERWFEKGLVASGTAALEIVPAPEYWPTSGKVLRVTPSGRVELDGVSHHGMPRNWSPYSKLSFTIAAEKAELKTLTLIIKSSPTEQSEHSFFQSSFLVNTTPRQIAFFIDEIVGPNFGLSHLQNIDGINILAENSAGQAFYVDDLRLD